LRVNRREEEKWEDLERDGWKKLKISTGDEGSKMVTKGSGQRRMDYFLQKNFYAFLFSSRRVVYQTHLISLTTFRKEYKQ